MTESSAELAGERALRPGRELLLAGLLALSAGLLYGLTYQTRFFGDGPGLYSLHVLRADSGYPHVLYLPLCDLVEGVLGLGDPGLAPKLVSVLGAALGVGLTFLVLRSCAATLFGALVATGLVALSPALWFFATTVEVHAPLFGVVALVAAITLHAPWRRTGLALTLVAAAFPLLHWAHQSTFLLGVGWVLLVQYARTRVREPFPRSRLWLGVGPLLLLSLCAGIGVAFWVRFGGLEPLRAELAKELTGSQRFGEFARPVWRDEWLLPSGVLVPLGLAGLPRLRRSPHLAPAIVTLLAFPAAFFLSWGVIENGGYFLGSLVFLAVPVAHLFGRWSPGKAALALVLLGAQGSFAHHRLATFDRGWDPAERAAQVRASLGDSGTLLTTVALAPDIGCALPAVEEISLVMLVLHACQKEGRVIPPAELLPKMQRFLSRLLRNHERVAVDLAYPRVTEWDSPVLVPLAPTLAAIEAFLRRHYVVRDVPHEWWPLLLLERERDPAQDR